MTETMKAARFSEYGGPDVLSVVEVARPEPAAGQALIKIHAASVNPIDWKIRSGAMKAFIPLPLPSGAGQDLAGVIVAVGTGVTDVKVGDEVYAMMGMEGAGAYAEFVALDRAAFALKPKSLDFENAAATPMGALTAWQAIVDLGGLKSGDRLFVHAAAGNVGGWAVRIGKALGAHVTAAGRAADRDALTALGAETFVDYDARPFEAAAKDFDVVLDPLAGDIQARSWSILKPGGILVSTLMAQEPGDQKARGVHADTVHAVSNGERLARIAEMIDAGGLKPTVGRVLFLSDAAEAQRLGESGAVKGKIVLTID